MTTRRQVLAGAFGLGVLAACKPVASPSGTRTPEEMVLINHADGMGVVDAGTGKWVIEPGPAALTVDRTGLAVLRDGELSLWRLPARERVASSNVDGGGWKPLAVSGDRAALVRRTGGTTTIRIAGLGRDFDLPGNIEPEAFSPDGTRLYVLDHRTDFYRVRMLDLQTGELHRLNIKDKGVVPVEAEEIMRGHWRQAVWHERSGVLFSLYTHGGDHQHTGQLLGVRPDAPHIHSFIHALHLAEGWAVCIDLPSPFGDSAIGAHALTLGANLYAVNAAAGALAEIDLETREVLSVKQFTGAPGDAFALAHPLLIGAGARLTDLSAHWQLDAPVSGLASGKDGLLWTACGESLVALDWPARRRAHEIAVPGLRSVIRVV